jgi:hypothetical protein
VLAGNILSPGEQVDPKGTANFMTVSVNFDPLGFIKVT